MKIVSVLPEQDLDPQQYQNELNVANVTMMTSAGHTLFLTGHCLID